MLHVYNSRDKLYKIVSTNGYIGRVVGSISCKILWDLSSKDRDRLVRGWMDPLVPILKRVVSNRNGQEFEVYLLSNVIHEKT